VLVNFAGVAVCQESPGEWVEFVESDVVFAEAGEKLGFYSAVQGVIDALVGGGLDPAVLVA